MMIPDSKARLEKTILELMGMVVSMKRIFCTYAFVVLKVLNPSFALLLCRPIALLRYPVALLPRSAL
jgi:hypothetical protein